MYYSKNIILSKLHSNKVWLYKDGVEYTDITGGWVANGTSSKTATTLKVLGSNKENRVETVNQIDYRNGERIFFTMRSLVTPPGRWAVYIGNAMTGSAFINAISKNTSLSINDNLVTNIYRTVGYYKTVSSLDILGMWLSFGSIEISEVWIEKYEN